MDDTVTPSTAARWFAACNLVVALAIALAVFGALPVRGPAVRVPAVALMSLLMISSAGLLRAAPTCGRCPSRTASPRWRFEATRPAAWWSA